MSKEEYYQLDVAEYELKIHRELECPNWLKLQHPELFRDYPEEQENRK